VLSTVSLHASVAMASVERHPHRVGRCADQVIAAAAVQAEAVGRLGAV
jgi:hypothetical protein